MKNRRRSKTYLFTALLAVAASGWTACHHEAHHEEAQARFLVTSPKVTDTEIIEDYVAQIRSIQRIEVRALERGYIQGIFVDEGQPVKKGQKMFQIMPLVYAAERKKAAAEAEFARIEYENTKALSDKKVVSKNELALAKAKLDKAHGELAVADAHLTLTEVRAPFDGIMDRLEVRQGSLVEEGELLTSLSDNSKMWVYFNVTEAEYLDYKQRRADGEPATVRLRMANDALFAHPGKVETIEAEFDNETGTIAFRATFPNPEGLLRHGETGKVLMSNTLKDALLVPQKATFEILDKKFVFVVGEDNTVRAKEISIAEELPHLYVVKEGLGAEDRILLEGLRKVRDGDEIVQIYQPPAEAFAQLDLPAE